MARWKKNESLSRAMAREGAGIAKGVGKELLSIATLGFYKPKKSAHEVIVKYPSGKVVKYRR